MLSLNDRYRRGLQKECGVTDISVENASRLIQMIGKPSLVEFISDGDAPYRVVATWRWPGRDNFEHTFTGFSWGFSGREPHGLAGFTDMIGASRALSMKQIVQMDQRAKGHVLVLARRGKSWLRLDGPAFNREKTDAH